MHKQMGTLYLDKIQMPNLAKGFEYENTFDQPDVYKREREIKTISAPPTYTMIHDESLNHNKIHVIPGVTVGWARRLFVVDFFQFRWET